MKGLGCLVIILLIAIVIAISLQPTEDKHSYLDSTEHQIADDVNVAPHTGIDWVEAGSVEFFAERGPEEYEQKLSSLKRYFNVGDYATYLYNNPPDLMREKFLGEIIVIHGEVDGVDQTGNSLRMEVLFYKGDKSRWGKFDFRNDSFPFAKGCQPGDYVLIKGTVKRIVGFANLTDLESSKIHYNFGPLE